MLSSFAEILDWDLSPLASGQEATAKRGTGIAQYSATVKTAPALTNWTGDASEQARALATTHAAHSDHIANQAQQLTNPLNDYATAGADLKTAAHNLLAEAQNHGYTINPDGSVTATTPQKGLYAQTIAQQLTDKATAILTQDQQLHQTLAQAIHTILNPDAATTPATAEGAVASTGFSPIPSATSPVANVTFTDQNLWPSGQPGPNDIHQKSVGDCWFDASMAAVANTEPDVIKNAITYDPKTKSFNVSLYNYPQDYQPSKDTTAPAKKLQTINITQADLKQDLNMPGVSDVLKHAPDGSVVYNPNAPVWGAVMEAAYAKQQYGSVADGLGLTHYSPTTGASGGIAGGWGTAGLMAITGHSGTDVDAHAVTYNQLHDAVAAGKPVVMGTGAGVDSEFLDGITQGHEYTVVGVSQAANGDTMVTARNPWGDNEVHIGANGERYDPIQPIPDLPAGTDPTTGYVTFDLNQVNKDNAIQDFTIGDRGRPAK